MKKKFTILVLLAVFGLSGLVRSQNNYSLQLDDVDDYVNIPSNSVYAVNDDSLLSVMCWIKSNSSTGTNSIVQGWYGYGFQVYLSNGKISFVLREPSGNGIGLNGTTQVGDGNWHNIACVLDGNNTSIFIDGIIEIQGTFNNIVSGNSTNDLSFGHSPWASEFFGGNIDDIQIWDVALDISIINQYMNCPPIGSEPNLIGYWNFEEGTGLTTADHSPSNNNGTLVNGVIWGTNVPVYSCCSDTLIADTTTYYVADNNFSSSSPQTYLESIDSLTTTVWTCDSLIYHYSKYVFDVSYCTDTIWEQDTIWTNDTIWINDTLTTEIYDTIYVVIYDSIAVTDTLIIDIITGIPQDIIHVMKVYPNPTNDLLYISIDNNTNIANYNLIIFNSLSQQVYNTTLNNNLFTVDISTWELGLYFVNIYNDGFQLIETRKIILE